MCLGRRAKDPSGVRRKDWGPKKKKDGGEIKIQKVAKALHKASGLHKQQARTLDSIKKADGGMIDMTKMKYV